MHSVSVLKDGNPTLFGDRQTERGGGGGISMQFCPYFAAHLKKRTQGQKKNRQKESACLIKWIPRNLKNCNEIAIRLPSMEPIAYRPGGGGGGGGGKGEGGGGGGEVVLPYISHTGILCAIPKGIISKHF